MCAVCDANTLIDAARRGESVTFQWGESMDVGLEVEVQGEAAEFSPVKLRVRRRFGELLKEASEWTDWYESGDLAGTLGQLGTDTKWEFVVPGVQAWLTGAGPFPGFCQSATVVTGPDALTDLNQRIAAELGLPASKNESV